MIKRIKCKNCNDDREMSVCGEQFICTTCGTSHDLEYIATSFFTPLMIEISYMINDLDELCGGLIDDSEENELEAEIDETEAIDTEDFEAEDAVLVDEEFLSSEEISKEEKAVFCLVNVYSLAIEEGSTDRISAFVDAVLKYDNTNFVACLIKALIDITSIPRYVFSRIGDAPVESLDSVPVSFDGDQDIKFSQALFTQMHNNDLAKHLQSILNLSLASIRNAPSEGLCLKVYHIAAMNLDVYEVLLQISTLNNLKEMPTLERYREYIDYGLAMSACKERLQQAATARLDQLGARQVNFDMEEPHFHEFFPDIPNWGCHLAEVEYRTAEDIWEKDVIARIDRHTGQVDELRQLQVLDSIYVVALLLGQYTDVDKDKASNANLHELKIAQKMISLLLNIKSAEESFSFKYIKNTGLKTTIESAEELTQKLAIIDEELAKRKM